MAPWTCLSCAPWSWVRPTATPSPQVIEHTSENTLDVEQGSLYPALHRLEDRGMLSSEWGLSENNRRAKFYRLTPKGRKELVAATSRWRKMTRAIGLILGESTD
jgi:PadR family transcriptional regulator PadR